NAHNPHPRGCAHHSKAIDHHESTSQGNSSPIYFSSVFRRFLLSQRHSSELAAKEAPQSHSSNRKAYKHTFVEECRFSGYNFIYWLAICTHFKMHPVIDGIMIAQSKYDREQYYKYDSTKYPYIGTDSFRYSFVSNNPSTLSQCCCRLNKY